MIQEKLAKTYFKKSRVWLSQRVNGNIVNGKPCVGAAGVHPRPSQRGCFQLRVFA